MVLKTPFFLFRANSPFFNIATNTRVCARARARHYGNYGNYKIMEFMRIMEIMGFMVLLIGMEPMRIMVF